MVAVRIRMRGDDAVELVDASGAPVSIRPTSARLLAALLTRPGDEVASDELVRRTWGDALPADPTASLHTAIARLRRVLPDGAVVRGQHGYRLDLLPELVDDEPVVPAAPRPPRIAPTFVPTTPLVGRDDLLARGLDLVMHGRGVVFHGDAGSGRSRLVEEIVLEANRSGRPAALLRCRAVGGDVPLGVYSSLLQGSLPASGLPLVIAARTSIAEQLAGDVMVLGIDDLHQIDQLSAVLTMQLVQAGHVVLAGTHRNMRVVPIPVADLWHDGYCEHVHVGHLDRGGLALLAAAHSGRTLSDGELEQLWQLTNGNPLFATTVLQQPDLRLMGGDPTLEAVIAGQLAGLPPDLRDALAVVAIGEPLSITLLEQIVDVESLIKLERASLIAIDRTGNRTDVRVRHPLYGEHVRAGTSRLLARGIRGQLAAALASQGTQRRDDLMRLARWSLGGGRTLEPSVGVAAAREAMRHDDLDLARRTARSVWESHGDVEAALVLAEVALLDEPGHVAVDVVRAALGRADTRQRRRLLTIAARAAVLKLGDPVLGDQLLGEGADDPALTAIHAQLLAYQGRAADSLRTLDEVEAQPGDEVYRAIARATALTQLGFARDALDVLDGALEVLDRVSRNTRTMRHQITAARARPLMMLGELVEAEHVLREAMHAAGEATDALAEGLNALALGGLLPFTGRAAESMALAQRAIELLTPRGYRMPLRWAWLSSGFAAAVAGDLAAARSAVDALSALQIDTMTDGVEPLVDAAIARLEFDRERAASILREGAAMCRRRALLFEEAVALHDLARCGHETDVRVDELAEVTGGLVATFAVHARAIGRDDPAELMVASDRFAAHGAWPLAAEAAARAAEAAAGSGSIALARRHVARFDAHAARFDRGLVAPSIVAAEPLTAREREIAEMAARGWTNPSIAQHLDLSVRTVDNHLSRTFEKLAAEGRSDLPRFFGLGDG
ncbi:MAG: winged helix-turn-helix domain-containing protein [Actinobacteria bacterium]|nr:winged helix-turn-helix domain-containing protein [Actinomycetota bacterium]